MLYRLSYAHHRRLPARAAIRRPAGDRPPGAIGKQPASRPGPEGYYDGCPDRFLGAGIHDLTAVTPALGCRVTLSANPTTHRAAKAPPGLLVRQAMDTSPAFFRGAPPGTGPCLATPAPAPEDAAASVKRRAAPASDTTGPEASGPSRARSAPPGQIPLRARPSTSGLTRCSGVPPFSTRTASSAVRRSSSRVDACEKNAVCGVTMTFSRPNRG